ncbi:MAG: hypothetical protein KBG48_06615 [Kofleriaceae bacterium]|nr:hypothetical protein [Kofleriaceae bacterium]MBP9167040.1 hypothetical protein [Kofleriaceae bacterium]MBP9860246.1 hypothetical protein [Kofleriaceae bacterium]
MREERARHHQPAVAASDLQRRRGPAQLDARALLLTEKCRRIRWAALILDPKGRPGDRRWRLACTKGHTDTGGEVTVEHQPAIEQTDRMFNGSGRRRDDRNARERRRRRRDLEERQTDDERTTSPVNKYDARAGRSGTKRVGQSRRRDVSVNLSAARTSQRRHRARHARAVERRLAPAIGLFEALQRLVDVVEEPATIERPSLVGPAPVDACHHVHIHDAQGVQGGMPDRKVALKQLLEESVDDLPRQLGALLRRQIRGGRQGIDRAPRSQDRGDQHAKIHFQPVFATHRVLKRL